MATKGFVFVIRIAEPAAGAGINLAAFLAGNIRGKSAAVIQNDDFLFFGEGLRYGLDELWRQCVVVTLFKKGLLINQIYFGEWPI